MTEKNRIGVHVLLMTATLFLVASISYGQTSNTATAPTPAPTVGSVLGQVTFKSNCGFLSGVGSGVGIGIAFDGKNLWYSCYNSKLATVSATDTTTCGPGRLPGCPCAASADNVRFSALNVRCPPRGMASRALTHKFINTWCISVPSP